MRSARWYLLSLLLAIGIVLPTLSPVTARQGAVRGIDPTNMDLTVEPGEDFYRFVNGGWLDRTEIPGDEGSYGVFNELDDLTREQLLALLNEVSRSSDLQEGSDEWKAAELYAQGMDIDARNARGIEPIQPVLDEIEGISSLEDLHAFQQTAGFEWLTGIFWVFVLPDLADSSVNAAYLSGPFLGMPNRDYYLEDEEGNADVREAYIATVAELLQYTGYDATEAEAAAQSVYDFEASLAATTLTREEQQDFSLLYNPMTLDELTEAYPMMDWDAYMTELGIAGTETLVVTEPRYLDALAGLLTAADLEVVKDFYKMEVFWSFADYLSEDIGETAFTFTGEALEGTTEQRSLDERTLDQTSQMLGEAIGKLYVEQYFPPEAKEEIEALVDALIVAFRARLEANPWMSETTKARALEKLDALIVKVGYPDTWRTYVDVEIGDTYYSSFLSAANAETRYQLAKAGKPVDRDEWFVPPQVVNAFYDVTTNSILFPAAILQAPFFDYQADPAINFGGIGFVIGHEITHGFDVGGSQFDAQGNLANWWTEEDQARFGELNDKVAVQYSEIEVSPGLAVDGQITVGENVADLGGLQTAYDALEIYLATEGDARALADMAASPAATPVATPLATPMASPVAFDPAALTPQQLFFISAATVWREETREASLETQVRSDDHAPAKVRGTQPLRNMDAFYDAFGIQPGDAMYLPPDERVVVW